MADMVLDYWEFEACLRMLNEFSNVEFHIDIEGKYTMLPTIFIDMRRIQNFQLPSGYIWAWSDVLNRVIKIERYVGISNKTEMVMMVQTLAEFNRLTSS